MTDVSIDAKGDAIRWGLWGTVLWGLVVVLSIFIVQTVVLSVYVGFRYGAQSQSDIMVILETLSQDGLATSIVTIATFVVCSTVLFIVIKLKQGTTIAKYLALRFTSFRTSVLWFFLFLAIMYGLHLVTSFFGAKPEMEYVKNIYASAQYFWLLAVAIVIAAPIFEELFFRGFLVGGWKDTQLGAVGAVVISALLWAAIHTQYNIIVMVQIFVLGLILGFARVYTGSTLLPIGLHAFNNFASLMYMISISQQTNS